MKFRRRQGSSSGSSNANQLLSLALFIMLLAFFIVLSTLSSYQEEKIESIMGSIEDTFSTNTETMYLRRPSVSSLQADAKNDGETTRLEELEKLFNSQITAIDMVVDPKKGTMWVRVDYNEFYEAVMAISSPEMVYDTDIGEEVMVDNSFLPTLVSLLRTNTNNTVYRMDMILNLQSGPINIRMSEPGNFVVERDRIGLLARLLSEEGLPERQMSIGLAKGEQSNVVDLVFRPYSAFDAVQEREDNAASRQGATAGGVL